MEINTMSNSEIREPKQKRSIEKKRKIVEAGFRLFGEKGFYNTNTAEIAKEAGVSTGIVYNYFKDKKDIFLDVIKYYAEGMTNLLYNMMNNLEEPYELNSLVNTIIDIFTSSHSLSQSAHEEMMAMSHTDEDVREYFCYFEVTTANTLVEILDRHGLKPPNAREKILIAMGMIEDLCHKMAYHNHDYMNYPVMKQEVIRAIVTMMRD